MTNTIRDAIARYGFTPTIDPVIPGYPSAKPLYRDTGVDVVKEHAEWCAAKCCYPENAAAILAIAK